MSMSSWATVTAASYWMFAKLRYCNQGTHRRPDKPGMRLLPALPYPSISNAWRCIQKEIEELLELAKSATILARRRRADVS